MPATCAVLSSWVCWLFPSLTLSLQSGREPGTTLASLPVQAIQALFVCLFLMQQRIEPKQYYLAWDGKNTPSAQLLKRPGVA